MSDRNNVDLIHSDRKKEREKAEAIVALVRAQEQEKERNYEMKWVRDPEDRTLWRWVKGKKKTI